MCTSLHFFDNIVQVDRTFGNGIYYDFLLHYEMTLSIKLIYYTEARHAHSTKNIQKVCANRMDDFVAQIAQNRENKAQDIHKQD